MTTEFDASRFLSSNGSHAAAIEIERSTMMMMLLVECGIDDEYYTNLINWRIAEMVEMIVLSKKIDLKFNVEFDGKIWAMIDIVDDIIDVVVRRYARVENTFPLFIRIMHLLNEIRNSSIATAHAVAPTDRNLQLSAQQHRRDRVRASNIAYAHNVEMMKTSDENDIDLSLYKKHSFGSTDVTIFNFITRPISRHKLVKLTRADDSTCNYVYVVRSQSDGTVKIGSAKSSGKSGIGERFGKCGDYVNYVVLYLIRVDGLNDFKSMTKNGKLKQKTIEIVELAVKKLCGHMRATDDVEIVNDTKIAERLIAIDFSVLYEIESNPSMILDFIAKYSYAAIVEIVYENDRYVDRPVPKNRIRERIGAIRHHPTYDIVENVDKFLTFVDGICVITSTNAYKQYVDACCACGAKPKSSIDFNWAMLTICTQKKVNRKDAYWKNRN